MDGANPIDSGEMSVSSCEEGIYGAALWFDLNRGDRFTPETSGVLRDIGRPVRGLDLRGSIPFALKRVALHAPEQVNHTGDRAVPAIHVTGRN